LVEKKTTETLVKVGVKVQMLLRRLVGVIVVRPIIVIHQVVILSLLLHLLLLESALAVARRFAFDGNVVHKRIVDVLDIIRHLEVVIIHDVDPQPEDRPPLVQLVCCRDVEGPVVVEVHVIVDAMFLEVLQNLLPVTHTHNPRQLVLVVDVLLHARYKELELLHETHRCANRVVAESEIHQMIIVCINLGPLFASESSVLPGGLETLEESGTEPVEHRVSGWCGHCVL